MASYDNTGVGALIDAAHDARNGFEFEFESSYDFRARVFSRKVADYLRAIEQ